MKKAIQDCKDKIQELGKIQESLYDDLINTIENNVNTKLKLTEKVKNAIFDYVFNDSESPTLKEFLK